MATRKAYGRRTQRLGQKVSGNHFQWSTERPLDAEFNNSPVSAFPKEIEESVEPPFDSQ
jgi:hypothetical protein